jgi:dihydroorotate dehydrogenase
VYRVFFWLVLRWLPAETAHHLGMIALRAVAALPGARRLIARACVPRDPALRVRAFGRELPSPIGLAAGLDKDAVAPDLLAALGFGFVEVGTVTARPQPGNPRPRLFRLPRDRALINRMGFNNAGAAAAAARLARRRGDAVVGGNIGKSKAAGDAEALDDYRASARALGPVCDYLVVNVSSPNTPGLRDLQATARLEPLLRAIRAELDAAVPGRRVPLLVKIAPDLADEDVDAVADLARTLDLDGIVATNTTIGRGGLTTPAAEVAALGAGGLSGPALAPRALAVLRRLRARVGAEMLLVAAGGISTAADVAERLAAGATLVQIYTAFVYGGPGTPRRLARDLGRRSRG